MLFKEREHYKISTVVQVLCLLFLCIDHLSVSSAQKKFYFH